MGKQIEKTFKLRIYPNNGQIERIEKTFEATMFVYNYFFDKCIKEYADNKLVGNFNRYSAELKELKKNHDLLKEVDSISLQSAIEDLRNGYIRYMKKLSDFPVKKTEKRSYRTKNVNNNIRFENGKIKIPKIGYVKYKSSVIPSCNIVNATIRCDSCERYYLLLFCTNIEYEPYIQFEEYVTIELGKHSFCFISDGEEVKNPGDIVKYVRHISKLKKKLERQIVGSNNYKKTEDRINKYRIKKENEYHDFLHQLSNQIIHDYSRIIIEKPDCMAEEYKRNISAYYWNRFIKLLLYKAKWNGNEVVIVPKLNYPRSAGRKPFE